MISIRDQLRAHGVLDFQMCFVQAIAVAHCLERRTLVLASALGAPALGTRGRAVGFFESDWSRTMTALQASRR